LKIWSQSSKDLRPDVFAYAFIPLTQWGFHFLPLLLEANHLAKETMSLGCTGGTGGTTALVTDSAGFSGGLASCSLAGAGLPEAVAFFFFLLAFGFSSGI
jgi:hypothetical protein